MTVDLSRIIKSKLAFTVMEKSLPNCSVFTVLTLNMKNPEAAVSVLRSVIWKGKDICTSDVIAVGNGHGSQNAMKIVKEAIGPETDCIKNVIYVDETGASIYSGKLMKISHYLLTLFYLSFYHSMLRGF